MLIARLLRCFCVSVGTTLLSASILVALTLGAGVDAAVANVVAVVCGIVPSYLGNRRWVWGRTGHGSMTREVLPFWMLALTGLAASTVAVDRVASVTNVWPASWRAVALPVANLGVFAVLWVVQFAVLDRIIFRTPTTRSQGIEPCPAP